MNGPIDKWDPNRKTMQGVLKRVEALYLRARADGVADPVFVAEVDEYGDTPAISMITRAEAIARATTSMPDAVGTLRAPREDLPLTILVIGEDGLATMYDNPEPASRRVPDRATSRTDER